MRTITFETTGTVTRVRLNGTLQNVKLDIAPIKSAKANGLWTPKMQEDYLKAVDRKLADEGFRGDEAKIVIERFKKEIAAC